MGRSFAILLITFSWLLIAKAEATSLRVGECWAYHARQGEESSFVVIRKIQTLPEIGEVVHVSVCNVKLNSPKLSKGDFDYIEDLPITSGSLRSSRRLSHLAKIERLWACRRIHNARKPMYCC